MFLSTKRAKYRQIMGRGKGAGLAGGSDAYVINLIVAVLIINQKETNPNKLLCLIRNSFPTLL